MLACEPALTALDADAGMEAPDASTALPLVGQDCEGVQNQWVEFREGQGEAPEGQQSSYLRVSTCIDAWRMAVCERPDFGGKWTWTRQSYYQASDGYSCPPCTYCIAASNQPEIPQGGEGSYGLIREITLAACQPVEDIEGCLNQFHETEWDNGARSFCAMALLTESFGGPPLSEEDCPPED